MEGKALTDQQFEAKVRENYKALIGHAMNLTKNRDDAEDLYQDTLVRGYRFKEKYLYDYSFSGWLRRIMTNIYINNYHRKKKVMVSEDFYGESVVAKLGGLETDNSGYQTLLEEEIHQQIDRLEDKHKESFMLFFRGHKYHEIADRLKIPLGTVKNRIHIARHILKSRVSLN